MPGSRRQRIRWSRLVVCLSLFAQGCELPGKPDPAHAYKRPELVMDFDILFSQNCAGCHGAAGKLGPAPPLNDPLFLELFSFQELRAVVEQGRQGTPMPAFAKVYGGHLTQEQVTELITELHFRWGPGTSLEGYPRLMDETQGNAAAGATVFIRACAGCHGEHGGGGQSAGAINNSAFLALMSDRALWRIIITGRPDLGMPDCTDPTGRSNDFKPLSSQDVADLVALLASWRTP